jgi:hypothetical protein
MMNDPSTVCGDTGHMSTLAICCSNLLLGQGGTVDRPLVCCIYQDQTNKHFELIVTYIVLLFEE